jgi:hypothetical protein
VTVVRIERNRGAVASSGGDESADFQFRRSGPGVVWYHNFDSVAEVDAFRWRNGFLPNGQDPLAEGNNSTWVRWNATGGVDGGGCFEIHRDAGTAETAYWWRPFSPIVGGTTTGNGRGVGNDDPGASGSITAREWVPTPGSNTMNGHVNGWYGHPAYHGEGAFDGVEFWVQIRVKRDLNRGSTPSVGKSIEFGQAATVAPDSQTFVTYSALNDPPAWRAYAYWEGTGATPIGQQGSIADSSWQPGGVGPDWAYSGGWDTLLYHFVPGREDTMEMLFEVYGANEGETEYTLFTKQLYTVTAFREERGWQAMALMVFNNSQDVPVSFTDQYDQIIFSKDFIPVPRPASALEAACLAIDEGDSATFSGGTGHGLVSAQLDWCAVFFHDPLHDVVQLMGKQANDDNDWRLRTYSITGNSWTTDDHDFSRSGHIYASWCMDITNGDLYIAPSAGADNRDLWHKPYGQAWELATSAFSAGASVGGPHATVFHPNCYGPGDGAVITCTQVSAPNNSLCYYRTSTGAVARTAVGASLGGTSPQGVYFPAVDKVVVGRSTHVTVEMNTTTFGDVPVITNVGASPLQTQGTSSLTDHGVMIPHPGNWQKLLLLEKGGADRYWESTDGDTWTEVGTHPFPNGDNDPIIFCSLRGGYGCVWGIGESGGSLTSILWRPPV